MKFAPFLLFVLCCTSAVAQKALSSDDVRPLAEMIDSLSYWETFKFEENYALMHDPDSGRIAISVEKFFKGTTQKTPDQYLTWFSLWDIDPTTIAVNEEDGSYQLILFAGNNKLAVHNMVYVDKEEAMYSLRDRTFMGYWKEKNDIELLRKIRIELIRLINLCWEGNPPKFETDINKVLLPNINGKEMQWIEGGTPGSGKY